MKDFSHYRRSHNDIKLRSGEKIFNKQLKGNEGVDVTIDGKEQRALVHNNLNPTATKEYRGLHFPKTFTTARRGSYVKYHNENYLIVTDIDDHYVYWSCKIQKCNQMLKWKQLGKVYEFPCLLENDSYGVKIVADNEYIRNGNIKAKITVQANEITNMLVPNTRFMFNHSEYDIYEVVDINKSITNGLLVMICEKVAYQREDDIENNLAFSEVLAEGNAEKKEEGGDAEPPVTPPDENPDDKPDEQPPTDTDDDTIPVQIIGIDSFVHSTQQTYGLNKKELKYKFYIDEFDSENIATIISQENNECIVEAKYSRSTTWFTLYVLNNQDEVVAQKQITVRAR